MARKQESKQWVVFIIVLIVLVLGIGLIIYWLTDEKETTMSDDNNVSSIDVLECKATSLSESFFDTNADDELHEIKITFNEKGADKIAYEFTGTYGTNKQASDARTLSSIKYSKDVGLNGLKADKISSAFNAIENVMRIYLTIGLEDINAGVVKFFLMNTEDYERVDGAISDDFVQIYETKGFICNYKDGGRSNK